MSLLAVRDTGGALRYLSFVHRSPYATWNSLQAWIRHERELPEEVVLAHLATLRPHAETVARGVRVLCAHYGGDVPVHHLSVADNTLETWKEAMGALLATEGAPFRVDVTGARTIPKMAAAQLVGRAGGHELVYLDVQDYRYEAKPFPWIPYNIQTIRFLHREEQGPRYRAVQYLDAPPGVPSMNRLGATRIGVARYEATVPWEALVVLLNEAGAAKKGREAGIGVEEFQIKLPELGVTIASYNLETRRFRLASWQEIERGLHEARSRLDGAWQDEVPLADFVLESLASARLLPFADQRRYEAELHRVAAETRGPNPGTPLTAIAMDTNLFYLEFFTAITHAAKVPMVRIPLVASSVSQYEIRHRLGWRFPKGEMPQVLRRIGLHHPHEARKAHTAHEEFEMLKTRCRMTVLEHEAGQAGGPGANDANDEAILLDFRRHQDRERQELLVLSNDRGFVDRATRVAPNLDVRHIGYGDPETDVTRAADVDQVAYFLYRLALGYGSVSLKGLGVEVLGDHPAEQSERFLHEDVRVRVPDTPWVRGFLHEQRPRETLRQIVAESGTWL